MDRKTMGLLAGVAAVALCGCPGAFSLCLGSMFALISYIPGADIDVFGSQDPQSALMFGLGAMCAGVVLILIAAGAVFLLRRRLAAPPTA
ncbi:MAG: hypothetical protein KA764_11505 [Anaerolineales bacterium]|nr:hypothetical protein [Anaerolineales bacterium]